MALKAASGPQSGDTFFIDIFFKEKKRFEKSFTVSFESELI